MNTDKKQQELLASLSCLPQIAGTIRLRHEAWIRDTAKTRPKPYEIFLLYGDKKDSIIRIGEKLIEEAGEAAIEATRHGPNVAEEAADVIFHILVLLRACDVSLSLVIKSLQKIANEDLNKGIKPSSPEVAKTKEGPADLSVIAEIATAICKRRHQLHFEGNTQEMLAQKTHRVGQHLNKKAGQLALAAATNKPIVKKTAVVIFNLMVLLEASGIPLLNVMKVLWRRNGKGTQLNPAKREGPAP